MCVPLPSVTVTPTHQFLEQATPGGNAYRKSSGALPSNKLRTATPNLKHENDEKGKSNILIRYEKNIFFHVISKMKSFSFDMKIIII